MSERAAKSKLRGGSSPDYLDDVRKLVAEGHSPAEAYSAIRGLLAHARSESPGIENDDEPTADDELQLFGEIAPIIVGTLQASSFRSPYSLGVDGEWGSGKTSLLLHVQQLIDNEHSRRAIHADRVPVRMYFVDGWALDGATEYAVEFVEALRASVVAQEGRPIRDARAAEFARVALAAQRGHLRADDVDALRRALVPPDGVAVIVIDDLDRCRPASVISGLRLSRAFRVDGFHTIYLANCDALVGAVRKGLGVEDGDARSYLQKVVTNWFKVPTAKSGAAHDYLQTRLRRQSNGPALSETYARRAIELLGRNPRVLKVFANAVACGRKVLRSEDDADQGFIDKTIVLSYFWPDAMHTLLDVPVSDAPASGLPATAGSGDVFLGKLTMLLEGPELMRRISKIGDISSSRLRVTLSSPSFRELFLAKPRYQGISWLERHKWEILQLPEVRVPIAETPFGMLPGTIPQWDPLLADLLLSSPWSQPSGAAADSVPPPMPAGPTTQPEVTGTGTRETSRPTGLRAQKARSPEQMFHEARLAAVQGDSDGAARLLLEIATSPAADTADVLNATVLASRLELDDLELQILETALKLPRNKNKRELMIRHAAALDDVGRREEAEAEFEELLRTEPKDDFAAAVYSDLLVDKGPSGHERALEVLQRVASARGAPTVRILRNIARSEKQLQRFEDADKHFAEAVQLGPGDLKTIVWYANFLSERGRKADAEKLYRKAVGLERSLDAMLALADFLDDAGKVRAVQYWLEEAYQHASESLNVRRALSTHWLRRGDTSKAEAALAGSYRRELTEEPDD